MDNVKDFEKALINYPGTRFCLKPELAAEDLTYQDTSFNVIVFQTMDRVHIRPSDGYLPVPTDTVHLLLSQDSLVQFAREILDRFDQEE